MKIMKRFKIRIYGLVQGVFFRVNTKKVAEELGLNGWIKNKEDGSVEVLVEGEESKIQELLKWCKKGSSASIVEKIEIKREKFNGEFKSFEILY